MKIFDMPKLESPFVRKLIGGNYVVTPEIAPGFEWVFEDPSVLATEKLHGTNVSIIIENGVVTQQYNRTTRVPFINSGRRFITEGVLEAFERGYVDLLGDGQHFGELIGPGVNSNPYNLNKPIWVPYTTYVQRKLFYNSWGKYPKTYDAISAWFKDGIFSLLAKTWKNQNMKPEGIVFYQPSTDNMAKLRLDMFDWYKGVRHKEEQ